MTSLDDILKLDKIAKKEAREFTHNRVLYDRLLKQKGRHFDGIIGPRGVGKTIILKQLAANQTNSVYISLDSINHDLFELVSSLNENYQIKNFFLDEIHYEANYSQVLKKIYDFLKVKITFSSSISLSLYESSIDLSRRVLLHSLEPFSFKQYLFFKYKIDLPALSIDNIMDKKWSPEHLKTEGYFFEYLQGGLYPFTLDEPVSKELFDSILKKVIHQDIIVHKKLDRDDIINIEKTIKFIGKSPVDGINYTSISQNIAVTKFKAEQYLRLLEKSFILKLVFPVGTNVMKEPKVLMRLPYRLLFIDDELPNKSNLMNGAIKEDFFAEASIQGQLDISYLKTTRGQKTPDFVIHNMDEKLVVEIGGKGKGRQQFKDYKLEKKIILTHPSQFDDLKRPLFLLGFME